jgi:hypothetical protein
MSNSNYQSCLIPADVKDLVGCCAIRYSDNSPLNIHYIKEILENGDVLYVDRTYAHETGYTEKFSVCHPHTTTKWLKIVAVPKEDTKPSDSSVQSQQNECSKIPTTTSLPNIWSVGNAKNMIGCKVIRDYLPFEICGQKKISDVVITINDVSPKGHILYTDRSGQKLVWYDVGDSKEMWMRVPDDW